MLVLARNENERLLIGDDIVITVVRVRGGNVRLGIEAPRDITVLREELETSDCPQKVRAAHARRR